MFGNVFVAYEWPKLLGGNCFEYIEGKGAWACAASKYSWRKVERNKWISQMIRKWQEEKTAPGNLRQHYLDTYGISFVKHELPALLRRDGFPEEEVLRLTKDGPDMEPPPRKPVRYIGEVSEEELVVPRFTEIVDSEDGSHVENSDGEIGSDEPDEDIEEKGDEGSHGWETVDEG